MATADMHTTLVSIADRGATARRNRAPRTGDRAAAPAAAAPAEHPAGPLTYPAWLNAMCTAASCANCGHCWAEPGEPCSYTTVPVQGTDLVYPVRGYHPARFGRAHRRAGTITAAELAALTAGMLPGALVWDNGSTPREVTP
jgi:hypothetical protein